MTIAKKYHEVTQTLHSGRTPEHHFGVVNTPVYRASTILFKDYQAFKNADFAGNRPWHDGGLTYGRRNTPITHQLADTIKNLEGGDAAFVTCSGVSAIAVVMSSLLSTGDHVLISDSVYNPTKMWAEHFGTRMGISFDYIPAGALTESQIKSYFKPNTKLVMVEAPGSLTFEIADIPLISKVAHEYGAAVAIDNTWSAGVYFKPFEKGCDISIQAGTKYFTGHSDACFGSITCTERYKKIISQTHSLMGQSLDGDTAFLALRGMRTLHLRLKQHYESGLKIADFLENHPKIKTVLHPALPSSPDYGLWKRDFTGACGLFSIILRDGTEEKMERFVNHLKLFGMGFSWGGFESLVMPCLCDNMMRQYDENVRKNDCVIRMHIGLEDAQDLQNDLEQALDLI
jgi:cysteine-S-conjugate beta-lyase